MPFKKNINRRKDDKSKSLRFYLAPKIELNLKVLKR